MERISGLSLDDYFKKNIFKPLGIENISFKPSQQMRENMVTMQQRERDGVSHDTDHVARRMILHADDTSGRMFQAGGAGCFAKPKDYCRKSNPKLSQRIRNNTHQAFFPPPSNPHNAPQQRHLPHHQRTHPQIRNRRRNVQEPDTRVSRLCAQLPAPQRQGFPLQPGPGDLPARRQPAAGVGFDLLQHDCAWRDWPRRQHRMVGGNHKLGSSSCGPV